MTFPVNSFKTVATYQRAGIALLTNDFVFIDWSNKKFQNFQNLVGNLGTTTTFELAPKMTTTNSLTANFQGVTQRYATLVASEAISSAFEFSTEQLTYNDAMDFAKSSCTRVAIAEIGSQIESYIGQNLLNHTYRFYGDGTTAINSYGQLAEMVKRFSNFGSVKSDYECVLPDIQVASIINSGLNQFVPKRNEDDAKIWELGVFARTKWAESNLLPTHISGTIGNAATAGNRVLTVLSTDDPTGANITRITFDSNIDNSADAIHKNDIMQIIDDSTGPVRFLTWIGGKQSQCPLQLRSNENVASDANGHVAFEVSPHLSISGTNKNINKNIIAGMKFRVVPSHRAGFMMSGKPVYLAMPRLPQQPPFITANESDPDSGAFVRLTYGALLGTGITGFVLDSIYGSTGVDEQLMRVVFPLDTGITE